MNSNALPALCNTCAHNDHGMCFSTTWCVHHPSVLPEHNATDLFRAIEVQGELFEERET